MEIMIFTSSNLLMIIFLTRVLSHSAVSLLEQEQQKRSKVIKSNKLIGVYISICDQVITDTDRYTSICDRLLLIGTPVFAVLPKFMILS